MLTQNDIKLMKEVFATEHQVQKTQEILNTQLDIIKSALNERLDNLDSKIDSLKDDFMRNMVSLRKENDEKIESAKEELTGKLESIKAQLENVVVKEFHSLLDILNISMSRTEHYSTTVNMQIPVVRDHERRITDLEEKCN